MTLPLIKEAFFKTGQELSKLPREIIEQAGIANPWFTPEFIQLAADNWSKALSSEKINQWLEGQADNPGGKKVGLIMAGNIPFVGLHDLLAVLACGHKAIIKLSGNDEILMKYVIEVLKTSQALSHQIETETPLNQIDYLIATGSNNSARYFEYYFRNKPLLIRKNRTSLAVLSGKESDQELLALADDIFTYFGLGCRNVTHLILPEGFELKRLYEAYDKYMHHVHHHKYYNNYMYHKSILLMNLDKHYDNGFMLFQEKKEVHAPIATLNYHYYSELREVLQYIEENLGQWQCIVSHMQEIPGSINFGTSQTPELWDYADKVDTLAFLNQSV